MAQQHRGQQRGGSPRRRGSVLDAEETTPVAAKASDASDVTSPIDDLTRSILGTVPSLHAPSPLRRSPREVSLPLAEPSCRLFASGRHALWYGIRNAGLGGGGEEILAPAFNCGSEIESLVRAGLIPRFYEATETLQPDHVELETLVGPRTRALLLIHYLGFPQGCRRWRTWCDDRGLLLVEDCAHMWHANTVECPHVGSYGDIAIYSLSKTLGLPDGGVLISNDPSRSASPKGDARPWTGAQLGRALKRYGLGGVDRTKATRTHETVPLAPASGVRA